MFRKLLTLKEAQKAIQQHFEHKPVGIEQVRLLQAGERILAENVHAFINIPPFNRSTVDGYAVKSEDTFGAEENRPTVLEVCGTINIGEKPKIRLEQGKAAEIVTGAPIPDGADAVVMTEHTERKNETVNIFSSVCREENVMKAGSDIKKGEQVLNSGQILGSREIGVLAALGMSKIKVYAIPKVAVLSTGPEIVEPGRHLPPAKVYDINAYSLSTAVSEAGGRPIFLGTFPDNRTDLEEALRRALRSANMVITSGGVSIGPKDVMPEVLDSLGNPGLIVCGIAIKPGKPTAVASSNGKLVLALPGHPTSALLMFNLLARPLIQLLSGRENTAKSEVKASATMRMFSAKGRRTLVMVKLKRDKTNKLLAEPVPSGASGAITTLAKADGFVVVSKNQQFIDEGEIVTVHLFDKNEKLASFPRFSSLPQHILRTPK